MWTGKKLQNGSEQTWHPARCYNKAQQYFQNRGEKQLAKIRVSTSIIPTVAATAETSAGLNIIKDEMLAVLRTPAWFV